MHWTGGWVWAGQVQVQQGFDAKRYVGAVLVYAPGPLNSYSGRRVNLGACVLCRS